MGVRIYKPANATFLHIPKTGGSSLQFWLLVNTEIKERFNKHAGIPYVKKRFPDHGKLFTIVRNPFVREVSWYFYLYQKTQKRIKAAENGYEGLDLTDRKTKIKYDVNRNKEILKKLNELGLKEFIRKDKFIKPQAHIARSCDIVLKLENIKTDFKKIQDIFQCYQPLYHVNKSSYKNYKSYYDDELINIVTKKHKIDLDYFGYTF